MTKLERLLYSLAALAFLLLGIIILITAAEAQEWNSNNNNNTKVDEVIKAGVSECSPDLKKGQCLGVMHSLDNICHVAYFPSCFGAQWNGFMDHLQKQIDAKNWKDVGPSYADDPYLTLNDRRFGSSTDQQQLATLLTYSSIF